MKFLLALIALISLTFAIDADHKNHTKNKNAERELRGQRSELKRRRLRGLSIDKLDLNEQTQN